MRVLFVSAVTARALLFGSTLRPLIVWKLPFLIDTAHIFQKPLIKECSLNHSYLLTMIWGTFLNSGLLKDPRINISGKPEGHGSYIRASRQLI